MDVECSCPIAGIWSRTPSGARSGAIVLVTGARFATYAIMSTVSSSVEAEPVEGELALGSAPGFLTWVSGLVRRHRERLLVYARRRGLSAEMRWTLSKTASSHS